MKSIALRIHLNKIMHFISIRRFKIVIMNGISPLESLSFRIEKE